MRTLGVADKAIEPARTDFGITGTSASIPSSTWEVTRLVGAVETNARFVITPTADSWIQLHFECIASNNASPQVWGRFDTYVDVSPAPPVLSTQTGSSSTIFGRNIAMYHASINGWVTMISRSLVPLAKNVTYTFKPMTIMTSGTPWIIFRDPTYSWFEHGELRPRLTS